MAIEIKEFVGCKPKKVNSGKSKCTKKTKDKKNK